MAKMSLDAVRQRASTVDRATFDATTDADIGRHKREDGYGDLQVPADIRSVLAPRALRIRLALTQQEMADALRIPVGTWRDWEQGHAALDPAARSLLAIVQASPETALGALRAAARTEDAA